MIDLSVIIPVYNAAPLIGRCLDSVFGQTTHYSYEVICVDDGSTDESVEIIKGRSEPNIVLYQQTNAGPAAARNRGVELAHGRYCAYLDADDYWVDGYIEKSVAFLDQHKDCVAVNVAQKHLTISGHFVMPVCYNNYEQPFAIEDFFSFWADNDHVCTGSATIRKETLREIGGQQERMRVTEDLELWLLISTYGQWGFIPEILFVSDGGDVTAKEGWLKKMERRWYNAPTITEWESRILKRLTVRNASYERARGKIVRNLAYCHLLSNRADLARKEILESGRYFTDRMGHFMYIASKTRLTWKIAAAWLKHREYHR